MAFTVSETGVDPVTGGPISSDFNGSYTADQIFWPQDFRYLSGLPRAVNVYGNEGDDDLVVGPINAATPNPSLGISLYGGIGDDIYAIIGNKPVKRQSRARRSPKIYVIDEWIGSGNDLASITNLDQSFTGSVLSESPAYGGRDVVRIFSPKQNLIIFITDGVDNIRLGDLGGRTLDFSFLDLFNATARYNG